MSIAKEPHNVIKWKKLINKDTLTGWQTEFLQAMTFTQNGSIGKDFRATTPLWHAHPQLQRGAGGVGVTNFKNISCGVHNLNWAKKAALSLEIGLVKFFILLHTHPNSQMCIRIYIFCLKNTHKHKAKKN